MSLYEIMTDAKEIPAKVIVKNSGYSWSIIFKEYRAGRRSIDVQSVYYLPEEYSSKFVQDPDYVEKPRSRISADATSNPTMWIGSVEISPGEESEEPISDRERNEINARLFEDMTAIMGKLRSAGFKAHLYKTEEGQSLNKFYK